MKGYIAFVKKEFVENLKNYRFLILFAIFAIFGMSSAFLAKFTPEIIAAFGAGLEITEEPVALDAWQQFFKNISGIGFSAFIILFGSCMSSEYSKGTLLLLVTKGLARPSVIMAKYTVAAVSMTVSFWVSFVGAYGYTYYLWPDASLSNVVPSAFFMWMIGFLYLSILILGCVLFKQTFTSILFTGGIVALFSVLSVIKPLSAFNPVVLTSRNVDLISGEISMTEFLIPFIFSVVLSVVFLAVAIRAFTELVRLMKYADRQDVSSASRKEYEAILAIFRELQKKRKSASNVDLMVEINSIISEYVQVDAPGEGIVPSRQFDISKIDFDLLRREFARAKKKNLILKDLDDLIQERLDSFLCGFKLAWELVNELNHHQENRHLSSAEEAETDACSVL